MFQLIGQNVKIVCHWNFKYIKFHQVQFFWKPKEEVCNIFLKLNVIKTDDFGEKIFDKIMLLQSTLILRDGSKNVKTIRIRRGSDFC